MSSIQFGGVISGLNTQSIIDALVAAEKAPLTNLQNKEATLTSQKAAYAQLGTAMDDLVAKLKSFTVSSAGSSRSAASNNTSVLSATAGTAAAVATYQISVDRLATATCATSINAMGTAVTGTESTPLSSLSLPGNVTAGQISAVVDGTIVHYTVGDPTTTTLAQLMTGLGQAITSQLQAGGLDPAATATVSVVGNRLQVAVSGATAPHSLSFGASSDTSNALGMLGIANVSAVSATNPTLTGATNLGVTKMLSALDGAGLTGLTSTTTGKLTINGTEIDYNTATDSLSTIISRINNSDAGVIASIDRANDKVIMTKTDTGAVAMDIEDTSGTLAAALQLAPGTINAQAIGSSAQVTVDGRSIISTSNTVTNAIDGVTLNLASKSAMAQTTTLTVGVDQTAVTTALNSFITSFNHLGDVLDNLTQTTPGTPGTAGSSGPLANDPTALMMFLNLRQTVLRAVGGGSTNSLGALGISTGAIGAAVGTTDRLQLDTAKLSTALTNDPNAVSGLLDNTTGPLGSLLTQLQRFEDPTNSQAYIQSNTAGLSTEIADLHNREADQQAMIDQYTKTIEARFTAMETMLATLQSQSQQLAAQLGYTTTSSGSGLSNSSGG